MSVVDRDVRLAIAGRRNGTLPRTRLGLLGLAFKAGTDDDLRDSPALAIAALLRQAGAPPDDDSEIDGSRLSANPYRASTDVDALVILTE